MVLELAGKIYDAVIWHRNGADISKHEQKDIDELKSENIWETC
jgi:hypothetical protein